MEADSYWTVQLSVILTQTPPHRPELSPGLHSFPNCFPHISPPDTLQQTGRDSNPRSSHYNSDHSCVCVFSTAVTKPHINWRFSRSILDFLEVMKQQQLPLLEAFRRCLRRLCSEPQVVCLSGWLFSLWNLTLSSFSKRLSQKSQVKL